MKSSRVTLAALLGGMLLASGTAQAEFRWPWEGKTDKKPAEKVEPVATPVPASKTGDQTQVFTGDKDDKAMLPRLHAYFASMKDLSQNALSSSNAQVKAFAQEVHKDSVEGIRVVEGRAKEVGVTLPGADQARFEDIGDRLGRGAGGARFPERQPVAGGRDDMEFLREFLTQTDAIRADFAGYKETRGGTFNDQLAKLFNDDLVKNRDQAKELTDQLRNDARGR